MPRDGTPAASFPRIQQSSGATLRDFFMPEGKRREPMPEGDEQDRVQISVVIGRGAKETVRRAAKEEGKPLSTFCREAIVRETRAVLRNREEAPA